MRITVGVNVVGVMQRLMKRSMQTLQKLEYQLLYCLDGLARGPELEELKVMRATQQFGFGLCWGKRQNIVQKQQYTRRSLLLVLVDCFCQGMTQLILAVHTSYLLPVEVVRIACVVFVNLRVSGAFASLFEAGMKRSEGSLAASKGMGLSRIASLDIAGACDCQTWFILLGELQAT